MKRRREGAPPVRVYTYGLPLGPTPDCAARVDEQLVLARRYKNDLIAIERARREAYAAIVAEAGDIAAIDARISGMVAEIESLRGATKSERSSARTRVTMPAEAKARIAEIKAALKEARAERKAMRAILRDPRIAESDARANEMVKLFRKASQLRPCGTYLKVEEDVAKSRRGAPPEFRRWDGSGRIVVQTTGKTAEGFNGLDVGALYDGSDNRIQIDPTPRVRYTRRHPEGVTVPNSATLRLRVAGEWATFPMVAHRPLPRDGVVKWAWVQRKRAGARWRWEFQLAIEAPSHAPERRAGHTVAIDFGAKGERGGRLVALAVGSDGEVTPLVPPPQVISALNHTDSLRAIRDRNFNAARETLLAWLAENDPPEWLGEALRTLPQWRSPKRLASVAAKWRDHRFDGDEAIFATIDAWRRQDRHLYQWEANGRTKALLRRRETYRVWAADLAHRYARLVTEDVDFAKLARNAAPEHDAPTDHLHHTRVMAAPSEARECVRGAFAGREERFAPSGRASVCAACGGAAIAGDYEVACTACGARMDADFARCWHLLRDAGEDTRAVEEQWKSTVAAVAALKGMG